MCDYLEYVVFCIIIMRLVSLGCLQYVDWGCERVLDNFKLSIEKKKKLVISISLGLGESGDNR